MDKKFYRVNKEVKEILTDVFELDVTSVTISTKNARKVLKHVEKHLRDVRLKLIYNDGIVKISEVRTEPL